jgi:CHASE2 domain-containing sensor protein
MNEAIPFISFIIIVVGLMLTWGNKKMQYIGWAIVSISMLINTIYCFVIGRIIFGVFNFFITALDGIVVIMRYKEYKKDCLEKRERFLFEIMNYKRKHK